jgi:hypothetical protein
VDAKLFLERDQPALQRADDARGDTGRMPVHAHNGTERLEPERVSETAQQFVTAVMMDYRLADHRPEASHPVSEPPGNLAAMQRQVGGSSPLGHQSSVL